MPVKKKESAETKEEKKEEPRKVKAELKRKKEKLREYSKEEIEKIIERLIKQGLAPSKIGIVLRDQYGIPDVKKVLGKGVQKILGRKIPEDLSNLILRAITVRKHLEKNPKDASAKRGLQLTESKIRRLAKYYVREGTLPMDWKYRPEMAEALLRG